MALASSWQNGSDLSTQARAGPHKRPQTGRPPRSALLRPPPGPGVAMPALLLASALAASAHGDWHAGAGLSEGDSFSYSVCERGCYEVLLEFHALLVSGNRPVWVVQASAGGERHILLLDPVSMELRPASYDGGLSGSLSRTLLHIAQFAPPHAPKPLEPGSVWGEIPGSPVRGTQLAVASRGTVEAAGRPHEASLLQYTVFETSTVAVSAGLPFPVSALVYGPQTVPDPPVSFAFELTGYRRGR